MIRGPRQVRGSQLYRHRKQNKWKQECRCCCGHEDEFQPKKGRSAKPGHVAENGSPPPLLRDCFCTASRIRQLESPLHCLGSLAVDSGMATMRPALLLFHPQLRTSLPRVLRRDLDNRLFARLKTTTTNPPRTSRTPKDDSALLKYKDGISAGSRTPTSSSTIHAKSSIRRGMNSNPGSYINYIETILVLI